MLKPIPNTGGRYYIGDNNEGVYSVDKNKYLKLLQTTDGYYQVSIPIEGRYKHCVHRLVAATYLPKPTNSNMEIDHIDGNKHNNASSNLRWVTPSENQKHKYELGYIQKINRYIYKLYKDKIFVGEYHSLYEMNKVVKYKSNGALTRFASGRCKNRNGYSVIRIEVTDGSLFK